MSARACCPIRSIQERGITGFSDSRALRYWNAVDVAMRRRTWKGVDTTVSAWKSAQLGDRTTAQRLGGFFDRTIPGLGQCRNKLAGLQGHEIGCQRMRVEVQEMSVPRPPDARRLQTAFLCTCAGARRADDLPRAGVGREKGHRALFSIPGRNHLSVG